MNETELARSSENESHPAEASAAEHFAFHGNGAEYFRIWIVNLLLSILTIGVYSAWAKVRTKRYFYGNTELAGDRFEYLASPIAILKGRLIGVALLVIYTVAGTFSTLLGAVAGGVLALLLPLIFIQAFRFNAHNSAWRGIRFGFDGEVWPACKAYLLWPLFGVLTLGVGLPYALYRINQYQIDNHRFGESLASSSAAGGGFYRIALISIGIFVLMLVAVVAAAAGFFLSWFPPEILAESVTVDPENPDASIEVDPAIMGSFLLFGFLGYFAILLTVFVTGFAWEAMRFKMVFNRIALADNRVRNRISAPRYFWILFSNMLLITVTLGMFTPWARVRRSRYLLPAMWLETSDLDHFIAAEADRTSAQGDEIGEAFDLGIGI